MNLATCQFHGGRRDTDGTLVFCGARSVVMYSYCKQHRPLIFVTLAQIRARAATNPLGAHKPLGAEHG